MKFRFLLDLPDADLLNIDLLDQRYTHLDLLDTDIFSKHFVCFEDVFKICFQEVFKTCLQDVLKTSWKTKYFYAEDVLKASWRRLKNISCMSRHVLKTMLAQQGMSWRRLEDALKTSKCLLGLFTNSRNWKQKCTIELKYQFKKKKWEATVRNLSLHILYWLKLHSENCL